MKTNALIKLHQRQLDVLDMIVSCNNRISNKETDLKNHEKDAFHFLIKDYGNYLRDRIKRYGEIKNRLIRYYIDIQERINLLSPIKTSELEGDIIGTNFLS